MASSTTRLLALGLMLAACGDGGDTDGGGPGGGPDVDLAADVLATVSPDVTTVVTVTWTTAEPTSGAVRFGLDGALDRLTPSTEASTEHEVLLLGLPAEREVSFQVVVDGEDDAEGTVTTGSLPADLPTLSVEGTSDRFVMLSVAKATNWVVMLDPEGNVVWYDQDDRGLSVFRALARRDGSGVVYSSAIVNGGPSPDSVFVDVSWTGASHVETAVPELAHDFVERTDGSLASLVYETRDGVQGNGVVSVTRDGVITDVWSAWDCFDPVENPGDDPEHGWTHTNALDYDAASGALYVGMRNLGTIAKVDPVTRACPWALGGTGGTVALEGTPFLHQHQFDHAGDRFLVFDNDGAPGNESRAAEYTFDEAAGTASFLGAFRADPALYSFILGDVHRLDDGDTLVVWSVPGVIDRYDADGARVWRATFDDGGPLGFAQVLKSPYEVE